LNHENYSSSDRIAEDKSKYNALAVDVDLTIESPFKTTSSTTKSKSSVHQQKITKMINTTAAFKKTGSNESIVNKSNNDTTNMPSSENDFKKLSIGNSTMNYSTAQQAPQPSTTTWKLKAVIDKRNLLIPVSNTNATIDDLTKQILTRYKAMFSTNDPTFREPEKVLLKSSDDLILFGQDFIKDVLNVDDPKCEVHVLIESLKDAPTLSGFFEQTCQLKEMQVFENVTRALKQSEESTCLNLKEIAFATSTIVQAKLFEVLAESIRLNSRTNVDYLRKLTSLDLSSNFLNDQLFIQLLESLFSDFTSLQHLNLAENLITVKSLKMLNDAAYSGKFNTKVSCLQHILFFISKTILIH
jgi:hypothetical protein